MAASEASTTTVRTVIDAPGSAADLDAATDDPECPFVREHHAIAWRGELLPPGECEEFVPFVEGEPRWTQAGAEVPEWALPAPASVEPRRPRARRTCKDG